MKRFKTLIACSLAAAALATSTAAPAQFGGLGKAAKGLLRGDEAGAISATDGEAFLFNAARSTRNMMISAGLLAQLVKDREQLGAQRSYMDTINGMQNIGEFKAQLTPLQSNFEVLKNRESTTAAFEEIRKNGTAEQRKILGIALANLAIGMYRNTELVGQAPDMVSGIKKNPALLRRAGDFKVAAELLGIQAKGLSGIAGSLPAMFKAADVKMPQEADATEPQEIVL